MADQSRFADSRQARLLDEKEERDYSQPRPPTGIVKDSPERIARFEAWLATRNQVPMRDKILLCVNKMEARLGLPISKE